LPPPPPKPPAPPQPTTNTTATNTTRHHQQQQRHRPPPPTTTTTTAATCGKKPRVERGRDRPSPRSAAVEVHLRDPGTEDAEGAGSPYSAVVESHLRCTESPCSCRLHARIREARGRVGGGELQAAPVKSVTAAQGMRCRPWIRRHHTSPRRRSSPRGEGRAERGGRGRRGWGSGDQSGREG
jgi:hypothetical protein